MIIRAGYRIEMQCVMATPVVLMLSVHPSRRMHLLSEDRMSIDPATIPRSYRDSFGNICHRLKAQSGLLSLRADFTISDSGEPDAIPSDARQHPVEELPDEALQFLLPSRYCDTEHLLQIAWDRFGHIPEGYARVQAVVDYAHERIRFGYAHACATRTAWQAHEERHGVCRDYAHLALTLCRCLNIPARYVTGYLGDIGVPADPAPMDFSAWFQVWLDGQWIDFDARHNRQRIGRILMAVGRDAADVAMITAFGQTELKRFEVVTHAVEGVTVAATA